MGADVATESTDATRRFTLWALDALKYRIEPSGDGAFRLRPPRDANGSDAAAAHDAESAAHDAESAATCIRFDGRCDGQPVDDDAVTVTPDSDFLNDLVRQLRPVATIRHAVPQNLPATVSAISPALFAPWQVDGGQVRLEGCTLRDAPVLWTTWRVSDDGPSRVVSRYRAIGESPVNDRFAAALDASELSVPHKTGRLRIDSAVFQQAVEAVQSEQHPEASAECIAAAVVWCKFASGKLSFQFDEHCSTLPFAGWAQSFVDGSVQPPKFRCEETGRESYHVDCTDDGRITVAESIATCAVSGRRLLETETVVCPVTGKRALVDLLTLCPITRKRVIPSVLVACSTCRQLVSPDAVAAGICRACQSLETVRKDEPRLARILGQYPRLDAWRKWRMAETETCYVLQAVGWLRRLLTVMNKDTLAAERLAICGRFATQWTEIPESQYEEFLGS